MVSLRVGTFDYRGSILPGLVTSTKVLPLIDGYRYLNGRPSAPSTLLELVGDMPRHTQLLAELAARLDKNDDDLHTKLISLNQVQLKAPLLYPGKIFCAGANYYDHVLGMVGPEKVAIFKSDMDPFFFMKGANTVCGTDDTVPIPKGCAKLDWEVELALVIGRKCRNVPVQDAAQYVTGYTVFIDMSARDLSRRPAGYIFPTDFLAGKAFDNAAPMGPCILLKQPDDPFRDFDLRLYVNDELKQDCSTDRMIVKCARQVSWLSQRITLNPGDVIATGTPAGTGFESGNFLRAGDVIRAEIPDIGMVRVTITPSQ